jgi:hypothetical protein
MHALARLMSLRGRTCLRAAILFVVVIFLSAQCDAGMVYYEIPVPAGPPGKLAPGGWGALVITLDQPAVFTTFVFDPACPLPTDGIPDLDSGVAASTIWQLGPGKYKLFQTDTPVDPDEPEGPFYGPFVIGINYDGNTAPKITSAFWQNKPVVEGDTIFAFNPQKDLMADLSQLSAVPEPSTLSLALPASLLLVVAARKKKASAVLNAG